VTDRPQSIPLEETDATVDDWLNGASFKETRVTIHTNPALWAELEPLYQQIDAARSALLEAEGKWLTLQRPQQNAPDEVLGAASEQTPRAKAAAEAEVPLGVATPEPSLIAEARQALRDLEAEAQALWDRYDSQSEVWHIRALEKGEIEESLESVLPSPAAPKKKNVKPERYKVLHDAYQREQIKRDLLVQPLAWLQSRGIVLSPEEQAQRSDVLARHNANLLSISTLRVVVNGVERPAPKPESILRMRNRPHGSEHFNLLAGRMWAVFTQDVELPAPKSQRP
jgi:hypothetical protein